MTTHRSALQAMHTEGKKRSFKQVDINSRTILHEYLEILHSGKYHIYGETSIRQQDSVQKEYT
jgi:hypothetical protein